MKTPGLLRSLVVVAMLTPPLSEAQGTYEVVHGFAFLDGATPLAALVSSGGVLYGTTSRGGAYGGWSGYGVVFRINEDGTGFAKLHDFDGTSGAQPYAGLVASGGVLYGTTYRGGVSDNGVVFRINEDGTGFAKLHDFDGTSGAQPYAGLVASGGVLYGTTYSGGAYDEGVVYKVNEDGTGFAILHDFGGTDGAHPRAALVASGGALFGTTSRGGAYGGWSGYGVVFSVNEDGTGFAKLHDFDGTSGAQPYAGLVASGGVLYGTTSGGGAYGGWSGYGVVFRINEDGTGFEKLHDFHDYTNTSGAGPRAGLVDSGGVLYGTTIGGGAAGHGVVFRINEDGTGFEKLLEVDSDQTLDDTEPDAGLVASGGVLYGTTDSGGPGEWGVVFRLLIPPRVANPTVAAITSTTATLGGNVTSEGSAAITERGVVYSLTSVNADPVIGGPGVTRVSTSGTTGVFTVDVTGLLAGVEYSFKAYATSSARVGYTTPAVTFKTPPTLSINDVSVVEGDSGYTLATFTITLSAPQSEWVRFECATVEGGSATWCVDHLCVETYGGGMFPGDTTRSFTVEVNGDTTFEPDETFFVELRDPVGATLTRARGVGTIVNDDAPAPALSINDVSVAEGHSGTTSARFTVTLSMPAAQQVTVTYATMNNSADATTDYVAQSGSLVFPPGKTVRGIIVAVNGDTTVEPDERFSVWLRSPVGAGRARPQGIGTIVDDDNTVTEGVVWTADTGVMVSGNDLTKTVADGWGNAGAVSTRSIALGDGYVEFVATETSTGRVVGLSHEDTTTSYEDIDFGAFLSANGTLMVYEGGISRGSFGTYAPGDLIRVSVTDGVVRYSRNATTVYTSTQTPVYPLLVDTALRHTGATIQDVVISGVLTGNPTGPSPTPTPTPTPGTVTTEEVVWTADSGVTASGNDLTKTAASGWGNAGAVSTRAIASGDGYVEFVATETTTGRMVGLSHGDTTTSYEDIDFGVFLSANGALMVYEGGVSRGSFGTYAPGDLIRVSVTDDAVRYSRNATTVYTSTLAPTYPLLVDTALRHNGATIQEVVISGVLTGSPEGPTPTPTPTPTPETVTTEEAIWTAASGVTASGNDLTKTAAAGWGNAGAISTRAIASGDGYVEFVATETNTGRMVGLSRGDTSTSYEDIDFAAFLSANGALMVYEGGVSRGSFGTYAPGDLIRVSVTGGFVRYSRNATTVYTSTLAPAYPLLVDTALRHTGATIQDVVISGVLTGSPVGPSPTPTP